MDKGILSYEKIRPNQDLIDEIWNFDVKNLDAISDLQISKYTIALGQWLIYYKAQTNIARTELNKNQSDLEFVVSSILTPEDVKKHGTKTAAVAYLLQTDSTISKMQEVINRTKGDLTRTDGIDKAVTELIAAFKRELSRRENELYTLRKERYGS
jgi:N6-adenosine-specific RNA methylase IME4